MQTLIVVAFTLVTAVPAMDNAAGAFSADSVEDAPGGVTDTQRLAWATNSEASAAEWFTSDEKSADVTATFQTEPTFSVERGFYDTAFELTLSTDAAAGTIYYTLNSSTPSSTNGTKYTGAITISGTTVVRAIAYYSDSTTSSVATHT